MMQGQPKQSRSRTGRGCIKGEQSVRMECRKRKRDRCESGEEMRSSQPQRDAVLPLLRGVRCLKVGSGQSLCGKPTQCWRFDRGRVSVTCGASRRSVQSEDSLAVMLLE